MGDVDQPGPLCPRPLSSPVVLNRRGYFRRAGGLGRGRGTSEYDWWGRAGGAPRGCGGSCGRR